MPRLVAIRSRVELPSSTTPPMPATGSMNPAAGTTNPSAFSFPGMECRAGYRFPHKEVTS